MKSAVCPSCSADIEIGALPSYDLRLDCPACDASLKIIWLDPVELDWWDYEDDEEGEGAPIPEEEADDLADFEERSYIRILDNLDEDDLENMDNRAFKAVFHNDTVDSLDDFLEDNEIIDQ